ncbi:ribonuclease T2 family protein [Amorphus coralli]|uniref:ribonuclease T2 family protein n=1 Tax=Amorphus coralli TaxID=340680 RepID=UPI00036BC400|nr:ribonuclease T2 [Amorphus coralli]
MAGLRRLLPHRARRAAPLTGEVASKRTRLAMARGTVWPLLVVIALWLGAGLPPAAANDVSGRFDFYVLSLSWSPSYCAAAGDRADPDQCDSGRPYAFVVHGLWPQYERGFPEYCSSRRAPGRDLVNSMLDIMPSRGLIRHEWKKHGSCAGVSPRRYFELTRQAYDKVRIPPRLVRLEKPIVVDPNVLERAFLSMNEGLTADAIAVTCRSNRIREVRICMTRDLSDFRACPQVDRNACRQSRQRMPPVRSR